VISRGVRARLLILAVALFGCGGVVTARLAVLQLGRGEELARRARQQRQHVHRLVPRRGDILDRDGRELAVSVSVDAVAAHPAQVEDPAATARALAPLLDLPARQIEARLRSDAA
jgi:cell division protein FtsI/penicillin-binding protein 2